MDGTFERTSSQNWPRPGRERDLVTARLQLTLAKEAERRAYDRDRMRRRRSQANHLVTAAAVAEATVIQPDPLAAQHVAATVLAALKEKP